MRSPSAGRRRALSLALLAGSLSTGAVQAQTHTCLLYTSDAADE